MQITEFDNLPLRSQLHRIRRIAVAALDQFGIQGARLKFIRYEHNAVYRVEDASGERFLLRIATDRHYGADEMRSEVAWLRHLGQTTDLLVPVPVEAGDGQRVVIVDVDQLAGPRHCALFRWLDGRWLARRPAQSTVGRLAEMTARMHAAADEFVPPAAFTRPPWDWQRIFGPGTVLGGAPLLVPFDDDDYAVLGGAAERIRAVFERLQAIPCSHGIIHGDLHRENVLVHKGALALIDFDDCGAGCYLTDVGAMLNSIRRHMAPDAFPRIRSTFVERYAALRPVPPDLDSLIDDFIVLREIIVLNHAATTPNENVRQWGGWRSREVVGRLVEYLG